MGMAVFLGGLKKGIGTILAETVWRMASTVISMLRIVPIEECSRSTDARAIIFFNVGDHVVEVALPTCFPARYTGTATRDAMLGTCGAISSCSYSASTSFQLISS